LVYLKGFYVVTSGFGYLSLLHLENPFMGLVEKEKEHHNMNEINWWIHHEDFLEILESF
jgi:hypothetical protein